MKKLLLGLLALGSLSSYASSLDVGSTTHIVSKPKHIASMLPISLNSDTNGVCIYLGFDRGLKGSKLKKYEFTWSIDRKYPAKRQSVKLDRYGDLVKQSYTKILGQITCIND